MAKNINHLQHVKSSVVEGGMPKLPAPSVLVEGELAVNYAADKETISLKNSSGVVVTFSSDNYYSDRKLGSGFTGENSGITVTQVIEDDERVVAAALIDFDNRKLDVSAYTPTDLSNYYTKTEVNGEITNATSPLSGAVDTLNANAITSATYSSTSKLITFTTSTGKTIDIDASDFIKDGMVNEVKVDVPTSGENSGSTCLIVTFNTDAGREDIEIPLSDMFDSELYYTKAEIDDVLGSGFTVSSVTSSITDVIKENEYIISSALIDIEERKLDASAYTPVDMSLYYTKTETDDKLGSGFTGENSGITVTQAFDDLNEKKLDASAYTPTDLSDYATKQWVDEERLGTGFTGENSGVTVTQAINDSEKVTAAALNKLNDIKLDASAYTPTDLSDYATKQWVDEERLGSAFTGANSGVTVTQAIEENEEIIAASLSDLDDRIDENETYINQVNAKADSIARSLSGYTPSGYSYSKSDVDAKLNDKLDASAYTETDLSEYYTKEDVDSKLGEWFSGDTPASSITEVIKEDELAISSALNDLNDKIDTAWDNAISGVSLNGTATTVTNHVAELTGVTTTSVLNSHSGTTIASRTSGQIHLPTVTAADNGKILMVVDGAWALVNPTTIYTGTGTPDNSQGNNGDIYLQTS